MKRTTVKELKKRLQLLEKWGFGDSVVLTWNPDTDDWQTITSMTYGKGLPVKLYTKTLYTDEP